MKKSMLALLLAAMAGAGCANQSPQTHGDEGSVEATAGADPTPSATEGAPLPSARPTPTPSIARLRCPKPRDGAMVLRVVTDAVGLLVSPGADEYDASNYLGVIRRGDLVQVMQPIPAAGLWRRVACGANVGYVRLSNDGQGPDKRTLLSPANRPAPDEYGQVPCTIYGPTETNVPVLERPDSNAVRVADVAHGDSVRCFVDEVEGPDAGDWAYVRRDGTAGWVEAENVTAD